MENQAMIAVWVIAILISFVPMPLMYKIIGIIVSIILIAWVTYMAHRNNRLTTTTLIINLLIIGWDLAIIYQALAR
ncbi:hypothetical protein A2363_01050 [Candidatus Gottesmanbacteria bacterium RIFOXYB1_FULL_47_11]|uniref:Uncharacterized protein n=1 Tax=Candidatus Gottesmanbacteria bacterium RIFOXYB1_FULL_47_11 TaxID=1798401 RepID=A0A1F6BGK1_9BACT|nr:MAG: hypothetical protein A2363_01050 [Candidatus Gottesmanbacteria bacterium RIFOXYB1_FULL_47_11]